MSHSIETICAHLQAGGNLITATQRLCGHFHEQFIDLQRKQEKEAWPTPAIFTLKQWLADHWQQQHSAHHLLSTHQETSLWLSITGNRYHAQLAKQAWQLMHDWDIHKKMVAEYAQTTETKAFQAWYQRFADRCAKEHWVSACELPHRLTQLIKQQKMNPPAPLLLLGFDSLSPAMQNLIKQINQQNPRQSQEMPWTSQHPKNTAYQVCLPNETQEVEAMAHWAKNLLAKNPQTKIGCIVPNLKTNDTTLAYHFTRIFAPETLFTNEAHKRPFNLSATKTLSKFPLIHAALILINLKEANLPNALIHSPFIAPQKASSIEEAQISPTQWASLFAQHLNAFGWPGTRTLSSEEHQLVEAWQNLLNTFASLTMIRPTMTHENACRQLQSLADNIPFQPKHMEQPIQILGPLEATGIHFDALWLMGCDAQNWPPTASPNPFLPVELQRRCGMPGANIQKQTAFYRTVTERLLRSSPLIITSYAEKKDDIVQQPSPLLPDTQKIAHWPEGLPTPVEMELTSELRIQQSAQLEALIDEKAPPVTHQEITLGGTQILKYQAACPFKAFAECRLQARETETKQIGLSPKEKGIALHQALATIWTQLKDHQSLCQQTDTTLQAIIDFAVNAALYPYQNDQNERHSQTHIHLERKRLNKLILQWLKLEKTRLPFTVLATEQRMETTLADLTFKVQIDRIDQLNDNQQLLIDYKTGHTSIQSWLSERPDEPQLPLYCVLQSQQHPIAGIAFAQIQPQQTQFKGLTAKDNLIPQVKAAKDWPQQNRDWQATLTKLAQDFQQGDARVSPKDGQKTCQTCHLTALCRVKTGEYHE